MQFLRFSQGADTGFGVLEGDQIRVYSGNMFDSPSATGRSIARSAVKLLPPGNPGGMIALWNNSKSQIAKLNRETPKEALYFYKPAASFATDGDPILYPVGKTERVVLEGEIGIVISKRCRNVKPADARSVIFGYTVVNDITAQDVVGRDKTFPQYTRGKGFDSFSIFGPVIDTAVDPMKLRIVSSINGKVSQDYPVTDLALDPFHIVASISHTMTLVPGDVIACGTSLGADPIKVGDTVEVRIEGIGTLVNRVVAGD
jgi:2-keto-4-pentenoate hydratase/2-oxohepta-3-ene-1,7-dioic acid hydratase in catechol pathway